VSGDHEELPLVDFGLLEWRPIAEYYAKPTPTPLLLDAMGQMILGIQDEKGRWRDVRDDSALQIYFEPVQWAVASPAVIETLTV
jgi:hypothetical protein